MGGGVTLWKRFYVRGSNFMTFAKMLCEIIWFVSRKHLLYPVAMVTNFS